jgi:DNA-binding SARP family transcriptional activator
MDMTSEATTAGSHDARSPATAVEVTLLGAPRVRCGTRVFDGRGGQLELFLVYLALHRHESLSRERLKQSIWGTDDNATLPRNPNAALNNLVHEAKQVLGRQAILREGKHFQLLLPAGSTVDVEQVDERMKAAACSVDGGDWPGARTAARSALGLMSGPLASGHEAGWLDDERRRFDEIRELALAHVARACLELGLLDEAGDAARELFDLDRLSEDACCLLMKAEYARGRIAAALTAFDVLARAMDEIGLEPSPETRHLRSAIAATSIGRRATTLAALTTAATHPGSAPSRPVALRFRAVLAAHGMVLVIGVLAAVLLSLVSLVSPGSGSLASEPVVFRCLNAFVDDDPDAFRSTLDPDVVFKELVGGEPSMYRGVAEVVRRVMKLRSYYGHVAYRIGKDPPPMRHGDRVAYDITWEGKQILPFPGMPLTAEAQARVRKQGNITTQIDDGRITSIEYRDLSGTRVDGPR